MDTETTQPSESTPEPNALPPAADDHVALIGNLSMAAGGVTLIRSDTPLPLRVVDPAILSNSDQPQPPRPPPFVPGAPFSGRSQTVGPATGGFQPGGFQSNAFQGASTIRVDPTPSGGAAPQVIGTQGNGEAGEIRPVIVDGRLETLDDAVSVGEITISLSVPAVDIVERRIAKAPDLYALLAANAAREIRAAINDLDAQKPNEPAALSGYEQVNRVLTKLATGFELVAAEIDDAVAAANPETEITRLRKVAETFVEMFDGFVGWFK